MTVLINPWCSNTALLHAGNLFICSDPAVHLHADENRHSGPEGPDWHEGLHSRPDHPGDGQHPQPVWEEHRQHGGQPDAGKHFLQPQPNLWVMFRLTFLHSFIIHWFYDFTTVLFSALSVADFSILVVCLVFVSLTFVKCPFSLLQWMSFPAVPFEMIC